MTSITRLKIEEIRMLLKDRVAIVTGGASGIGKAIILRFAAEGAKVAIADIQEEKGKALVNQVKKSGGEAVFVNCDVSDSQKVQAAVDEVGRKHGRIDILVNNAGGVAGDAKIEETTDAQWQRVVGINLTGQFYMCRAAIPWMKKNGYGKIVNLSSMGAISPPAPIVHYHAAKGGVLGLTTNLALELAHEGITVNAILPGPIKSEFFTEMFTGKPQAEADAFFKKLGAKVPMGRMGETDEIAKVALFLACDLSSFVTGEAINVGGGLPLQPLE
jgi:NAD(P)-dependent dehydrogenase (short-subunit alcohol dehydrogenase family)